MLIFARPPKIRLPELLYFSAGVNLLKNTEDSHLLRRSGCEPVPNNLGRQCQGDWPTLYSEGERKLGSRACNTSFQVSDWSHFLSNHSFKGKLWLSLEHILFAFHSGYANERWLPAPALHAQRAPKPASSGVYPGPWLYVFCSSRLWAGFLGGRGFCWLLKKTSELCIWHERRFTTEYQMKGKRQLRNCI